MKRPLELEFSRHGIDLDPTNGRIAARGTEYVNQLLRDFVTTAQKIADNQGIPVNKVTVPMFLEYKKQTSTATTINLN